MEWQIVSDTQEQYRVNALGQIMSCRKLGWKLLKLNSKDSGYKYFRVSRGKTSKGTSIGIRRQVHVVVWETFRGLIPKGLQIDHIDGNRANNCLENLRLASKRENAFNSAKRKSSVFQADRRPTSKYKGVMWAKASNKWMAQIKLNGKSTYLGTYTDEKEAARAYDNAALLHYGEFARTNSAVFTGF